MKKLHLLLFLLLPYLLYAQSEITGKVVAASDNGPIAGAAVKIKNATAGTVTLADGSFRLPVNGKATLQITHIGYVTQEIDIKVPIDHILLITMQAEQNLIREVQISTGYQTLPKDRATGSFVQVDNQLLNRSVSTDILSRLADVVPGLTFNKIGTKVNEQSSISIRGQSTLFAKSSPLIVVDNYPFEGDVSHINPNDVESITVLKDAAAASIWGTRAGNGVIVITTRKGKFDQPIKVVFNSNVTVAARPDLFYTPVMSTADFIDRERALFAQGYYRSQENSAAKVALTPVVELLIAARDGRLTQAEADRQIGLLKTIDSRHQISRYLFQPAINQQYNINLSGGSAIQRFYIGAGYDQNRSSAKGNNYRRISLDANNTYSLLNKRLTIGTAIFATFNQTLQNAVPMTALNYAPGKPLYPYAQLADDNGNALALPHTYRQSFTEAASAKGLLDWTYRPLEEIAASDQSTQTDNYRFNFDTKYQIIPGFTANVLYQYDRTTNAYRNQQSTDTWYTRDQINRLTIVNTDGSLTRPIPVGGILDLRNGLTNSHTARAQLNYETNWGPDHQLVMIGGGEVRDQHTRGNTVRYYGYDAEHAASQPVDYINAFGTYLSPTSKSTRIQNFDGHSDLSDRFVSYYSNAAYTFHQRITLSASARLDQSNLFGVSANQKGVPLYSAGLSWKIADEGFYKLAWLPSLTLRLTHGTSGNIDKSLSAFTTASFFSSAGSFLGVPYAVIQNPPNPQLRWERVSTTNLGIDFSSRNDRVSGSVDLYLKKGNDLIGDAPLATQTGLTQFRGNTAATTTRGIDVMINSNNLKGQFGWQTTLLLSVINEKVTQYQLPSTGVARDYLNTTYSTFPTIGRPLYAIYSYPWAGLDPKTGDPQGYLNGKVSKDYAAIINSAKPEDIVFHGSARPTGYGALRNTFSYQQLSVSFNIAYRLGYYTRRSSILYNTVLSGSGGHGDYAKRWQQPGDETRTSVPSLPAAVNNNRDNFYTYSSALVQRADNIRLQDINMSYNLSKQQLRGWPFSSLNFYLYANNLGILWKAAKNDLDPDAVNGDLLPPQRTIAFGIKGSF